MNSYSNVQIKKMNKRGIKMEENLKCEVENHNAELVECVRKNMILEEKIFDLAELFKVFGDSTRIKIINALMVRELCVCDIADITNSTPSAISHQLRVLKQAKLVKYRKDGKSVIYSLDDEHVREIFEKGCEHIEEV